MRYLPPARASIFTVCNNDPSHAAAPNHCLNWFASVHALKTSSRGASKTRDNSSLMLISSIALFVLMFFLLLQLFQIFVKTIKTFFPKFAIFLDPLLCFFHRLGLQFQRMHATAAAAADQASVFQHTQMLRDRR